MLTNRRPMTAILAILALAMFMAGSFVVPSTGHAQEAQPKRTILQLLFGKRSQKVQPAEIKPPAKVRKAVNPDVVKIELAVPKRPDAKRLLVVGDFMAKALGDGLTVAFAQSADVIVEVRANGSSGLVREDYYNWQETLPALIDQVKPAMVIIMLGANDRQQMSIDGQKEKFRSDVWSLAYQMRAESLARAVVSKKTPVVWVGMPAFQSDDMTADAATLNGFYRQATEKLGGEFVDIWDGFVDEGGKFAFSGSDINGQSVRLRGTDGLSFTKAGKRKLAFYVEKPIRHMMGNPDATALLRLDTPDIGQPANDNKAPVVVVSTPPISLADPELDGGAALLDNSMLPKPANLSPRDLLVLKGDPGEAPAGRVDDYRLTEPKSATP